jgi:hypothetical protein
MVHYVLYKDLDIAKYNQCIIESNNQRIYGQSWYLDCSAKKWNALVLNDFEAVMPLPIRKKIGISYVFVPPWTQQLGIFSRQEFGKEMIKEFMLAIPKKYKLVDIFMNSQNRFQSSHITKRDNYILPLETSYESLYSNFSKGRKSSIKQAIHHNLTVGKVTSIEALLQLFKENKGLELNRSDADLKILRELVLKGISLQKINVFEVVTSENKLIGGAIFLIDSHRITYLFSALNSEGREKQAMSFLIDFIIKKYANQPVILDFEGSMIYAIASFYRSFGAQLEPYCHYRKRRLL